MYVYGCIEEFTAVINAHAEWQHVVHKSILNVLTVLYFHCFFSLSVSSFLSFLSLSPPVAFFIIILNANVQTFK